MTTKAKTTRKKTATKKVAKTTKPKTVKKTATKKPVSKVAKTATKSVKKTTTKPKTAKPKTTKTVKKTTKPKAVKATKVVAETKKPFSKEPEPIKANAPMDVPVLPVETKPATPAPAVKVKKPKKPKIAVQEGFSLGMLPESAYAYKPADTGWRNYRLWSQPTLDWDDKDTHEAITNSIKELMSGHKKTLVSALKDFEKKDLMIKTDLKKDAYPFEPFIEVWIANASEDDMRTKLMAIDAITCIDPDFQPKEAANESQ